MKKVIKIILIILCTYLAVCQINNKIYSYTIEEVKEKIDFKIVEESGEPDNYDVLIDARELIDNEQLPCIETSIESIIYDDDELFNIDFFDSKSTKSEGEDRTIRNITSSNSNEEKHEFISGIVKAVFRVLLYISLALMLTLLIYIAIILVRSAISKKESILPLSNVFGIGSSKDTPKKQLAEKTFIEQWIISTVILIFIIYAINIIISFSNIITNITDKLRSDEEEDSSITIYVKNSRETVHLSSIIGTTTGEVVLGNEISSYINTAATSGNWAVYVKNLSSNTNVVTYNNNNQMPSASVIKLFIAAAAYEKAENDSSYNVNTNDMESMITVSDNQAANRLIDAIGGISEINSYISSNGYNSTVLNRKFGITDFEKDNYTSASDVGKLLEVIYKGECAGANEILAYMKNQQRRSKIPEGIPSEVEVANKTGELGSNYPNGPVENDAAIVYKENANYVIVILSSNLESASEAISNINNISTTVYNGIETGGIASSSSNVSNTETTRTFDYYFKTNLEGLLMFQSQYNWQDYTLENVINLFTGSCVTAFKIGCYIVFSVRTIVIAVFTAIAPLVVLINAFLIIKGNRGCLESWLKVYLYFVFLRPAISVVYYLFIGSNINAVAEFPLYIVFPIVGITVLFAKSFNLLLKNLNIKKKKSNAQKKAK